MESLKRLDYKIDIIRELLLEEPSQVDIRNSHSLLGHNRMATNVAYQMGLVAPPDTRNSTYSPLNAPRI